MSKRFQRWAESWIEDNIPACANPDLEDYDARARRLMDEMYAAAAAANFSEAETAEERKYLAPLVMAAASNETDFDYNSYTLKYLLAQEMEDGD